MDKVCKRLLPSVDIVRQKSRTVVRVHTRDGFINYCLRKQMRPLLSDVWSPLFDAFSRNVGAPLILVVQKTQTGYGGVNTYA